MICLSKISSTYDQVKCSLKNKSSPQLGNFKKDVQSLIMDIVVLGKENQEMFIRSLAMEGYLCLLSAKHFPVPLPEKRRMLQVVFDKIKPYSLRPECVFIFLRIQNLLCFYLIQLDQVSVSKEILENMEPFYENLKSTDTEKCLDPEDLFTEQSVAKIKPVNTYKIDKVITNNIQMQAYVYNKLSMPKKYAIYNHTALRRQLDLKDGTPQDWVVRAARLGNYFTYLKEVGNARHHLMAAYNVLKTCHENYKLIPAEFLLHKAEFEIQFLEISHYWVKYGLTLFKMSKEKILNRYFKESSVKDDPWITVDTDDDSVVLEAEGNDVVNPDIEGKGDFCSEPVCMFPSIDLKDMEESIPSQLVTKPNEARKLFVFTHKWLMRSKNHYDFEHHPSQYISCCLQMAELYENLAFFERNLDNHYTIQKKRADVLETLTCLLKNCDNVMSVQIDVIRELSQVQLELMTLNLQKLWREESQTAINFDNDAESIINCLNSESSKTLTEKNLNVSSKNLFLRKMEATTSINRKLFRLCNELAPASSLSSMSTDTTK